MLAVDLEGRVLGHISAVHNFGAGDLIEIRLAGSGKTELVAFTAGHRADFGCHRRPRGGCDAARASGTAGDGLVALRPQVALPSKNSFILAKKPEECGEVSRLLSRSNSSSN